MHPQTSLWVEHLLMLSVTGKQAVKKTGLKIGPKIVPRLAAGVIGGSAGKGLS